MNSFSGVVRVALTLALLGTVLFTPGFARNKQITVCIPVYNATRTLPACLENAAKYGDYQYLIYDNGSVDKTRELIKKLAKTYRIKTKLIPHDFNVPIERSEKSFNVGLVRAALAKDVKTPYLFFLDADVMLAAPIDPLINELTGEVGMVGYNYGPSSHLQMGAALLKTATAQQIDWNKNPTCECLNAKHFLAVRGLKTKTMPGIVLEHDRH
jgi:glycosyltransferase involved in cell wall biosynthesis